jgi:hypothetical protein
MEQSSGEKKHGDHEHGPGEPHAAAPVTINPTENNLTLNPGDGHTETIIVTVPASPGQPGYRNVKLVAAGATAVFVVSITPPSYGPLSNTTLTSLAVLRYGSGHRKKWFKIPIHCGVSARWSACSCSSRRRCLG